jgi:hypothetical protein
MNQDFPSSNADYEVRYSSLFRPGRGVAFPCDAAGRVNMDELSERSRRNYLFARAMVGREFASPVVRPCALTELSA